MRNVPHRNRHDRQETSKENSRSISLLAAALLGAVATGAFLIDDIKKAIGRDIGKIFNHVLPKDKNSPPDILPSHAPSAPFAKLPDISSDESFDPNDEIMPSDQLAILLKIDSCGVWQNCGLDPSASENSVRLLMCSLNSEDQGRVYFSLQHYEDGTGTIGVSSNSFEPHTPTLFWSQAHLCEDIRDYEKSRANFLDSLAKDPSFEKSTESSSQIIFRLKDAAMRGEDETLNPGDLSFTYASVCPDSPVLDDKVIYAGTDDKGHFVRVPFLELHVSRDGRHVEVTAHQIRQLFDGAHTAPSFSIAGEHPNETRSKLLDFLDNRLKLEVCP